ncbi:MAG: putative N-acetylmannosamine-6-phosphate 2-epimerase [Fimbriimonadaceae bacterium]|nr:putative N-acetylmannosamine-6-phosphate 2-epimerase [Fimbriimonadaceae bacterium]
MRIEEFEESLRRCPVVASVQASDGSPTEDPLTLLRLAFASLQEGAQILRLQGVENILAIKSGTGVPVIGLIKQAYAGSEVYITPTVTEVDALIEEGCEVIALDGTRRARPDRAPLRSLIEYIHRRGLLAMADCDSPDSVRHALEAGADIIGTTLAGYTQESWGSSGPDLEFLREAVRIAGSTPVLAEGRFQEPWQAQAALRIGAAGVVIGGALNDPVKQTRRFVAATARSKANVGAVDIGGTWLRFGYFSSDWKLLSSSRIALPKSQGEREAWIREQAGEFSVRRIGISTGGTVDPASKVVIEAKPIIPDYEGASYDWDGLDTVVLNDGLATAWGHANLPQFAGMRVATLSLGTGVGCGLVANGAIWRGPYGEYPRLNDLLAGSESFEELLGGAALTPTPTESQKDRAVQAARTAIGTLAALWMPDVIVVGGGVGLSDWLQEMIYNLNSDIAEGWVKPDILPSPLGADAGLYGAAALALFAQA